MILSTEGIYNYYDEARRITGDGLRTLLPQLLTTYAPTGGVLELGAGRGTLYSMILPHQRERLTQIEPDSRSLAENRRRHPFATVVDGDIAKLEYEDNSWKTVISLCLLDMMPDLDEVFREVWRVLKPGGYFIHVLDMMPSYEVPLEAIPRGSIVLPLCNPGDDAMMGYQLLTPLGQFDFLGIFPRQYRSLLQMASLNPDLYAELAEVRDSLLGDLSRIGRELGAEQVSFQGFYEKRLARALATTNFTVIESGEREVLTSLTNHLAKALLPGELFCYRLGAGSPGRQKDPAYNASFIFHVTILQKPLVRD